MLVETSGHLIRMMIVWSAVMSKVSLGFKNKAETNPEYNFEARPVTEPVKLFSLVNVPRQIGGLAPAKKKVEFDQFDDYGGSGKKFPHFALAFGGLVWRKRFLARTAGSRPLQLSP